MTSGAVHEIEALSSGGALGAEVCEAVVAATEKEEEEWRITKRRVSVRDGNRLQVKERGTVAGRGKKEKKIIKEE